MGENQLTEKGKDISNQEIISPLKKKNWKSYFKEFFMLFLAIVLGFIVENQRETYVENKSAEVLANSMVEDLVKDKDALITALDFNRKKDQDIADFVALLNGPKSDWDTTAIYQGMASTFTTFPFSPTDGTYTQMKSSGTLRYFDQTLVNKMNAYDNQMRKTIFRDELIEKAEWELVPLASEILNFEVTGELRFNLPITKKKYLHLENERTKEIFINKIVTVRTMMGRSLQEYKAQLSLAEDLIEELKTR